MRLALLIAGCGLALSACQDRIEAPDAPRGTCFLVSPQESGEVRFTAMPDPQPNMENCAARLEENRVRWLRSQYLFVDSGGVSMSRTLNGGRFNALRRTNDGRLAIPGAFEQEPAAPTAESGQTPQG